MITKADATDLRAIAARLAERNARTFAEGGAQLDASHLRSIADAIDEHLRPRSRREIEGDRRRAGIGLWPALRRLWSRRA